MTNGNKVTIIETTPIDSCKYLLVGLPDVGLAGSIALSYLIQEKQMVEIGYLESDTFPPVIVVHKGEPKHPLRIYLRGDIVAIVSEIAIDTQLISSIIDAIVEWAESKNVEIIIALSGIAIPNRLEIEIPVVYGVGSSETIKKLILKSDIKILEEGFVTGFHAVMMKECLKKNMNNIILLAQSHLQYPDPGASASLITSLNELVGLKVDTKKLLVQGDETRLKVRELMQRTQHQMQQTQKGQDQEIPLMYV